MKQDMKDLIKMFFLLCLASILATGFIGCNNDKKDSKETAEEKMKKSLTIRGMKKMRNCYLIWLKEIMPK